jgi:hypothetical protein
MLSHSSILAQARSYFEPLSKISPSDWACANLRFNEPNNHGPFSLSGRYYAREPLDSFADKSIKSRILVFGHQTGKTVILMASAGYLCAIVGTRIFWVLPTIANARKFSRQRLMKMIKASVGLKDLLSKFNRHSFQILEMEIGQSVIDLTGSNSLANLKSTPAGAVYLDETDEFIFKPNEINPIEAAHARADAQVDPIHVETSTPKKWSGNAWQSLLKSDLRRRYCPCPHCKQYVILVFDKRYTELAGLVTLGCEAEVMWDKEARKENGTWDLERVERSARHECPFCHGHILEQHKTLMDRNGEWRVTRKAAIGSAGWHLPSFNACNPEVSTGKIAVKFLEGKKSVAGVASTVSDFFALPYVGQATQKRREQIIESFEVSSNEWEPLMTVDCQGRVSDETEHFFWVVVQLWKPNDKSIITVAKGVDSWEEVEAIQIENKVKDVGVMVDAGYKLKEVCKKCSEHSEPRNQEGYLLDTTLLPVFVGWTPSKGQPTNKTWHDKELKMQRPFRLQPQDALNGTPLGGKVLMNMFEFSSSYFQDFLEELRREGEKLGDKSRWQVLKSCATSEFWRHMDGDQKKIIENKRNGQIKEEWQPRNAGRWPNHLRYCCLLNLAFASWLGFYKLD